MAPKKIIVCCDGTWYDSDNGYVKDDLFGNGHLATPSNVTNIVRALQRFDSSGTEQLVYYQAGIGTKSVTTFDHLVAGTTGLGLSEAIREAYAFLVNNYDAGDEVFLIGFSRGSFTVRSISGIIGGIGLLSKEAMLYFYEIFADYENAGSKNYKSKLAARPGFQSDAPPVDSANVDLYLDAYRANLVDRGLTRMIGIKAMGVWDTVGARGIPIHPTLQRIFRRKSIQEYEFHHTKLGDHISFAFQALALDEQRPVFMPTLWERPESCTTQLKQCWFAGGHANIGGGAEGAETVPPPTHATPLSKPSFSPALTFPLQNAQDVSLAWMMSNLSPFLAFSPTYLASHVASSRADAAAAAASANTAPAPPPRYGCGVINDATSGVWRLLGSVARSPHHYHQVVYDTDAPLPEMLQNTNERVHVSVRARMRFGGFKADGKTPYSSAALDGWVMQRFGRRDSGTGVKVKGVRWLYVGKGKEGRGGEGELGAATIMKEDEPGEMERELMRLVDADAERELLIG